MNQFIATIKTIDQVKNLHLVTFKLGSQTIKMVSLELDESLKINSTIKLNVKSTHISIAKNLQGELSHANQLKAKITAVNNGKLLSSIQLKVEKFELESLITLEASLAMTLSIGDDVLVLIKGNEVSVCG
jgi:molybdopterin-binding protein